MYCVNTLYYYTNSMIVKNLNFGTKIAEGATDGFYQNVGEGAFHFQLLGGSVAPSRRYARFCERWTEQ